VIVLGDLVGYGAEPNAVTDRLRALDPLAVIRGNHDKAGPGWTMAARSIRSRVWRRYGRSNRSPGESRYLRALPQGPSRSTIHSDLSRRAVRRRSLHFRWRRCESSARCDAASICLFGHTHLPVVFRRNDEVFDGFMPEGSGALTLPIEAGLNYLVNVGSVGQPRDGDPRAAFGIYDADALSLVMRRIPYPIDAAQRRILNADCRRAGQPAGQWDGKNSIPNP
jgi:diadenosine tetraphosphatase ApaH/serine/threonine PP2A family protein phosphatase